MFMKYFDILKNIQIVTFVKVYLQPEMLMPPLYFSDCGGISFPS